MGDRRPVERSVCRHSQVKGGLTTEQLLSVDTAVKLKEWGRFLRDVEESGAPGPHEHSSPDPVYASAGGRWHARS